jgi:hypothetical protein
VTAFPASGDTGDQDELALISAGFPAFSVWRQVLYDRTLYTAQARDLATHPSTVITQDVAELRNALRGDGHPPAQ